MMTPLPGQVWQHYKGGTYEVVSCAQHTEREEILVIYRSVAFGSVYARPLSIWYETVDSTTSKKKVPRFTQVVTSDYESE